MKNNFLKKFKKDESGAVVQFIIVLAVLMVISAFFFTLYKAKTKTLVEGDWDTKSNGGTYHATNGGGSSSTPTRSMTAAINIFPSTDINVNTQVRFSASAIGGTPPYTLTWNNYPEGSSSIGVLGGPHVFSTQGTNSVGLTIKDSSNPPLTSTVVKSFTVSPPLTVNLKIYDATTNAINNGPYYIGKNVIIKPEILGASGSTTCRWIYEGVVSTNCDLTITSPSSPEEKFATLEVCDSKGYCKTNTASIPYEYYPVQTSITSSLGKLTIKEYESIAFAGNWSGGSGNYSVTWTNYNGSTTKGLTGTSVRYPVGSHNITLKVCDTETSKCGETTITLVVESDPVKVSLTPNPNSNTIKDNETISFKINVTGGSGNYNISWKNYNGLTTNNSTGPAQTYPEGSYVIEATACDTVIATNCNTQTFNLTVVPSFVAYEITYAYEGAEKIWKAPYSGYYQFEIWGAQGGSNTYYGETGGYGGYVKGEIYLDANSSLYIRVGGQGGNRNSGIDQYDSLNYNGGWNGGGSGSGSAGPGGGGASDIRQGGNSDSNRILVAGGGGAGGPYYDRYGGNTNSLTSGSSGGNGCTGRFGSGNWAGDNGGGGGGYRGGIGSCSDDYRSGYGGSNFISTLFGNTSNQTGIRTGNGQIKITRIKK